MHKIPTVGVYLDNEEKRMIEALEADDAAFISLLTPTLKKEIEVMAQASLRPTSDQPITLSHDKI